MLEMRSDPDPRLETSREDFRIWCHVIETAAGLPEYKEMGETAGALAGPARQLFLPAVFLIARGICHRCLQPQSAKPERSSKREATRAGTCSG
jgi:hypothetical protein